MGGGGAQHPAELRSRTERGDTAENKPAGGDAQTQGTSEPYLYAEATGHGVRGHGSACRVSNGRDLASILNPKLQLGAAGVVNVC